MISFLMRRMSSVCRSASSVSLCASRQILRSDTAAPRRLRIPSCFSRSMRISASVSCSAARSFSRSASSAAIFFRAAATADSRFCSFFLTIPRRNVGVRTERFRLSRVVGNVGAHLVDVFGVLGVIPSFQLFVRSPQQLLQIPPHDALPVAGFFQLFPQQLRLVVFGVGVLRVGDFLRAAPPCLFVGRVGPFRAVLVGLFHELRPDDEGAAEKQDGGSGDDDCEFVRLHARSAPPAAGTAKAVSACRFFSSL